MSSLSSFIGWAKALAFISKLYESLSSSDISTGLIYALQNIFFIWYIFKIALIRNDNNNLRLFV